jgi:hypothetical protein
MVINQCNQTNVHMVQSLRLGQYMGVEAHQKSYWVDTQAIVIPE